METAVYSHVQRNLQNAADENDFESLYFKVRQQERRIYTDQEVTRLPEIAEFHVHAAEWMIRKRSVKRLLGYLDKKRKPLRIMDMGCGNGWLSASLGSLPHTQVIGFDVHQSEIEQAKRVFEHKKNLHFVSGSLKAAMLLDLKFDIILFSASIQYFSPLDVTLKDALSLLAPQGEIHIIDTHFYQPDQAESAEHRSRYYYNSLGVPEMHSHYYHHRVTDFGRFNAKVLFDPEAFLNKLLKRHPFYWIMINH